MVASTLTGGKAAQHVRVLSRLIEDGQTSQMIDRTLGKLLAYEADISRSQLEELQADLKVFEERYGISSAEFYRRFQAGLVDDRMDYVEWASVVQMAENLRNRLKTLSDESPE
jgi:hypothetical protein